MSDEFEMFTNDELFEDREFFLAEKTLSHLKDKEKMFKQKKEDIEKLQYEQDLIEKDLIKYTREQLGGSAYNIFRSYKPEIFEESFRHSRYLKEKDRFVLTKEALKANTLSYELITTLIKSNLIPEKYRDSVTFGEILACDYYAYHEYFMSIDDFDFIINIPIFNEVNSTNYMRVRNGYELRKLEGIVDNLIYNSLDYREFSKHLESWLDEQLENQSKSDTK